MPDDTPTIDRKAPTTARTLRPGDRATVVFRGLPVGTAVVEEVLPNGDRLLQDGRVAVRLPLPEGPEWSIEEAGPFGWDAQVHPYEEGDDLLVEAMVGSIEIGVQAPLVLAASSAPFHSGAPSIPSPDAILFSVLSPSATYDRADALAYMFARFGYPNCSDPTEGRTFAWRIDVPDTGLSLTIRPRRDIENTIRIHSDVATHDRASVVLGPDADPGDLREWLAPRAAATRKAILDLMRPIDVDGVATTFLSSGLVDVDPVEPGPGARAVSLPSEVMGHPSVAGLLTRIAGHGRGVGPAIEMAVSGLSGTVRPGTARPAARPPVQLIAVSGRKAPSEPVP